VYVDVIVRRYEAALGEPVALIETGETFDVLTPMWLVPVATLLR
jgi:hypothetical protein